MANGLSHYEAWRRLLDDGQDHRVLELVVNELDRIEAAGQLRFDTAMAAQEKQFADLKRRMTRVSAGAVTVLIALIGVVRAL